MADDAPPPPPDNPPTTLQHEVHPSPAPPPSDEPASPVSDPPPATDENSAPPFPAEGEEHSASAAAVAAATVIVMESELNEATPKEDVVAVPAEKSKTVEGEVEQDQKLKLAQSSESFKEETNRVSDLTEHERKALLELQQLVQEAIDNGGFSAPPEEEKPSDESSVSEISIWGIPLLKDERSDVILLKFLRARDFKVKDAFAMLKNTINWRRVFQIDSLLDEDLGDDLEKVVFMHGHDREGHPVCYNVYGEFQNKELYEKTFGNEEKREKFNRWRIQFLERSIRKLDFNPGRVNTIFQVSDLKNSPGLGKRELRQATDQALQMFQDNYPEFVAKQIFINVPWWYLAFYTMISPFLTQRSKSKFVFAGPAKSAETLFKYISPEQVPVQYGGLSVDDCDCNPEFTFSDPATEMTVKPGTKQIVEIIIYEKCIIVWELRVVGWEVTYRSEFVPNAEGEYAMIIQKAKKMAPTDEPAVHGTFSVSELGKLNLIVDNPTSKKKKLLYRFKIKPLSD